MAVASFVPKLGNKFYLPLKFFIYVRENAGLFLNADSLVVEGKCVGLSQNAHLEFVAMADIIEVSLKRLQKIKFLKNIPPNCTLFTARDFAAADPEEYFKRASNCVRFVGEMKAQGAKLEYPSETIDLYADSCAKTRSKRLKNCVLKFLNEKAPTAVLEKKKGAVNTLMCLSTPLFNPAVSFMELWMILAKKIYLSLGLLRRHEEGMVEFHAARLLVEQSVVSYLQVAGWEELEIDTQGSFHFIAKTIKKVQDTFANSDLAPDMTDPLKRIFLHKKPCNFRLYEGMD